METRSVNVLEKTEKIITLQHLVSKLDYQFRPVMLDRKTRVINEVPQKLVARTDEKQLATILKRVFSCLVNGTYKDKIYVSASENSNQVLIQVRSDHAIQKESLWQYLQPANQLANDLGGGISISDLKGTTVVITFLNKYEKYCLSNDKAI